VRNPHASKCLGLVSTAIYIIFLPLLRIKAYAGGGGIITSAVQEVGFRDVLNVGI
jgi:hypothetical protein